MSIRDRWHGYWISTDEQLPENDFFMMIKVLNTRTDVVEIKNAWFDLRTGRWLLSGARPVEVGPQRVVAWVDPLVRAAPHKRKHSRRNGMEGHR
jgi:hypothetical protein